MNARTLALVLLGVTGLCSLTQPAQADWLYPWGSGPSGDYAAIADPSGPPSLTGRDIRAYAQYLLPPTIQDSFWDNYVALYAATDRGNGFQAFRMDLKGTPTATGGNYAEYYVIAIDGVPGEGITLGGQPGIDRVIVSPWIGTSIGVPMLFKWTGSGFDAGTSFAAIPGADWQYGYGNIYYPPLYQVPPFTPGYGYTLEWKLPIGQLGTGPFTILGATLENLDLQNLIIYDQTAGIALGAASIIPEPSSVVLLGLGAIGFASYLIRRRKKA